MSQIIKIEVPDGEIYTIDCADPASQCETYGHLLSALRSEGFPHEVSDYKLVNANNMDLDTEDIIDFSQELINLRMMRYSIYIQDKGVISNIQVPTDCDVMILREQYEGKEGRKLGELPWDMREGEEEEGKRLGCLSIDGLKIDEYDSHIVGLKEGCTVRGLITVIITDNKCDTETPLDVYDYETIEQVLRRYHEVSRRYANPEATLQLRENLCENSSTVFECKIEHDCSIDYETPPYTIKVKEKDEEDFKEIEIEDYFTVEQVKEAYSRVADEGLVEGDKLTFGPQSLDEGKEMYKYHVHDGSVIYVEREDITQLYHGYYCVDCGCAVQLKKDDPVRCRNCGYRIVFKNRTTRACQYLAR